MSSKSETGHAVNIANFKTLVDACSSFGVKYNPSNANLSVVNMTAQWTAVNTSHTSFTQKIMAAKPNINNRELLFLPLSKLITRVVNLLNSTDASDGIKQDAKGLADKIRGFGLAKTKKPAGAAGAEAEDPDFVSKSHMGYVQRADNLNALCELLKNEPNYTPNESDLTTAALSSLYTSLKTANDGMGVVVSGFGTSRISRDNGLYNAASGITVNAAKCKKYVKGLYGAASAEYAMVSGLKFTKPR